MFATHVLREGSGQCAWNVDNHYVCMDVFLLSAWLREFNTGDASVHCVDLKLGVASG